MDKELEKAPVLALKELTAYTPKQRVELGALMKQLSERVTLTEDNLKAVVDDPNCRLYLCIVKREKAPRRPSADSPSGPPADERQRQKQRDST